MGLFFIAAGLQHGPTSEIWFSTIVGNYRASGVTCHGGDLLQSQACSPLLATVSPAKPVGILQQASMYLSHVELLPTYMGLSLG
jgi:hypothetical protein